LENKASYGIVDQHATMVLCRKYTCAQENLPGQDRLQPPPTGQWARHKPNFAFPAPEHPDFLMFL
jgi:hypothetical protein